MAFSFVELNIDFYLRTAALQKNKPRQVDKGLGFPFCNRAEALLASLAGQGGDWEEQTHSPELWAGQVRRSSHMTSGDPK